MSSDKHEHMPDIDALKSLARRIERDSERISSNVWRITLCGYAKEIRKALGAEQ